MIPALILGFFAYSQINELLTERERANMRSRIIQESSSAAQRDASSLSALTTASSPTAESAAL